MVRKKLRVVYRGWSLFLALLVALPIGLLQGGAIAADAAAPATEQSPQATQAPYSTYDLEWIDLSRGRAVPVRLYLPAAASSESPVPLVGIPPVLRTLR
jgi:predicted dienelactone hydrolase